MPDTRYWSGAAGDNNPDTAGNWDTKPVNGDSVVFAAMAANATKDVHYNATHAALTLVDTIVEEGCYLKFGTRLAAYKTDSDYLIYQGQGDSAFLEIVNATEIEVFQCGSGGSETFGLNLTGVNGSGLLIIDAARHHKIGLAALGTESATFPTVQISGGDVEIGETVTMGTHTYISGGTVENRSAITALTQTGGVLNHMVGAITAANLKGGSCFHNSVGTLGTLNHYNPAILDYTRDARAKTITTYNYYGGTLKALEGQLTITNKIDLKREGTLILKA